MSTRNKHPDWIWKSYELALLGLSRKKIAEQLGTSEPTYLQFLKRHPSANRAIQAAQAVKSKPKSKKSYTLDQFIYGYLPPHLREYYGILKLSVRDDEIEVNTAGLRMQERQILFLHTWYKSNFNFTSACRTCGVPYNTVRRWQNDEPKFGELCNMLQEVKKDFIEGAALGLVKKGNAGAILELNRSLNADRGYNPKFQVQVSGGIQHDIRFVDIERLNLPLDVQRLILERMRAMQPLDLVSDAIEIEETQEHTYALA